MMSRTTSVSHARRAIMAFVLIALAACRTTPAPQEATVVVFPPDPVYSGDSVEIQVTVVRGEVLGAAVELSLVADEGGITAESVSTTDAVATMTIEVDATVPADTYSLTVVADDGVASVESEAVALEVLGVLPGALRGEVRSLLIPTPSDLGFVAPTLASSRFVSMVPGDDVPLEHDEMRAVPGEVLVRLASTAAVGAAREGAAHRLRVDGVDFVRPTDVVQVGRLEKWVAATPLSVEETIALARRIEARPDVVTAMPNWIFSAHQTVPPAFELQWHFPSIDLHAAWSVETGTSNAVTVAVIDTGYQAHVDLEGIWLPGYDFVDLDDDATEVGVEFSHGTHVSGTIAMRLANDPFVAGVSHGAGIVPIRFLDETGSGTIDDLLAGMVWASGLEVAGYDYPEGVDPPPNEHPADVINMSLGGRVGPCPVEMANVTQALVSGGVVLVASAGNASQDTAMFSPGNCPGVITVGATGPYDERAYYSNFGADVDVFAPGGNFDFGYVSENILAVFPAGVLSTTGAGEESNWLWAQGTSMAAPHVSGLVALLLAADPTLDPEDVRFRLTSTATPLTFEGCDRPSLEDCGAGLVNANLALGGEPASAWAGAPTVSVSIFACAEADCADVDSDSDTPASVSSGPLTRGYWPFAFDDLAPGTYAVWATVEAPDTVLPLQAGSAVVEVTSGESERLVIDLDPVE